MDIKDIIYLVLSVALCLGVGFIGGQFTDTDSEWFNELEKPSFYPPGYLFGIVWTALYIMIGVSLFLVIKKTKEKLPYIIFGVQLLLNFLWTFFFFYLKSIPLAILDIALLLGMIIWNITEFYKYSKASAYLLVPYLLWVLFATFLTISIYAIN